MIPLQHAPTCVASMIRHKARLRQWRVSVLMCMTAATFASASSPGLATDDIKRLEDAHANKVQYEVVCRWPTSSFDPDVEKTFRSRTGWWNAVDWYDDPDTSRRVPITAVGKITVGADLSVRKEVRALIGPPELQRGMIELVGRDYYVPPFPVDSIEAKITHYAVLSPAELKRVREHGWLAHVDVWGPSCYSTLVSHVIEQLRSATDCMTTIDGVTVVVSSRQVGITAWIEPDGSLQSARLVMSGGEVQRIEFYGKSDDSFFPARFPAEMRVIEESNTGQASDQPRLMQVLLFDKPKRLDPDADALVSPDKLGVTLIETAKRPQQPTGVTADLRRLVASSLAWGVAAAVIVCLAAIFVARRIWRNRATQI